MGLVADALIRLARFTPDAGDRADTSYRRTMTLLRTHDAPHARTSFDPGHITASAVILAKEANAILLVWHARLGRWLQPGGHVEPEDPDLPAAARREVREETGLTLPPDDPVLIGIDVHEIPGAGGEPAHWHHDFVFAFAVARADAPPGGDAPKTDWCPLDALEDRQADAALRRAARRAWMELSRA